MRAGVRSWIAALALGIAGCASPVHRAEQIAAAGGLEPLVIRGGDFHLRSFAAIRGHDDLLTVFLGGDGSPWIDRGRRIARDPSPRRPLALALAAETPGSVLYLGRPCYFVLEESQDGGDRHRCSSRYWTSDRYSAAVVASLVSAARTYAQRNGFGRILLVGYSGGGTLAALMARRMPSLVGLVTIAGNLDPDAWTALHGYLPLVGSLNPALQPPLRPGIGQWHLTGGRDTNVPYAAARRYLQRVPPDRIWRYPAFDHACCWVHAWPAALARIERQLEGRRAIQLPGHGSPVVVQ